MKYLTGWKLTLAKAAGWSLYSAFMFYVGLIATFPSEALKQRLIALLEDASGGQARIDSVDIGFGGSITAEGAGVYLPPKKKGDPLTEIRIESLYLSPSLINIFKGFWGGSFEIEAWGGRIRGVAGLQDREHIDAEVHIENVAINQLPMVNMSLGLELLGTVSGEAVVQYYQKTPAKTAASIDLNITAAKLKSGQIKGFDLPPLDVGAIGARVEIKGTVAKLTRFAISGSDIKAQADGSINVNYASFKHSTLATKAQFKLEDNFLEKNPAIKGATGMIAQYRGADGYYGVNLGGPMSNPAFNLYTPPVARKPAAGPPGAPKARVNPRR